MRPFVSLKSRVGDQVLPNTDCEIGDLAGKDTGGVQFQSSIAIAVDWLQRRKKTCQSNSPTMLNLINQETHLIDMRLGANANVPNVMAQH